jgi:hypothetical protein
MNSPFIKITDTGGTEFILNVNHVIKILKSDSGTELYLTPHPGFQSPQMATNDTLEVIEKKIRAL